MDKAQKDKGKEFKELHVAEGIFVMPNAWNAGSACMLEEAGFPAVGTTSAGIAFCLGLPDYEGVLTREAALDETRRIARAVRIPVSVDAENGYGHTPEEVAETIRRVADTGAIGASIEDYSSAYGTGDLYDRVLAVERIEAAATAAASLSFPFTLTARTECYLVGHPDPFGESVARATSYREAGADCLYVPGIADAETVGRLVKQVVAPVNVVMGPQTVLPLNYAGPHGELAGGSMDRRFFHRLGASLLARGQLCGIVRGSAYASLYGAAPGMPPEQMRHSDLIVVWSNNVTVSNLHLAREIKAARRTGGARLIVIDPKRTRIAEQADLFIQIRPGTDVVLALAMAAELERLGAHDRAFMERWVEGHEAYMAHARAYTPEMMVDICGVDRASFDTFAQWYRDAKTVGVSVGNGMERGRSGGSGLRAAMALQALTGNHGRVGVGVFAKPCHAFPRATARLQRPDLVPDGTRTINIVDVSRLLLDETLDPPIKAVFINNHNPVATHPDQNRMRRALAQKDVFVAGADVVMTDSMRYCDIVLPAASHFEHADIYASYGHCYLQRAEPVIPCVGESLPNTEIFRRLAIRFGFDDPMFLESDEALMDAAFLDDDSRLCGHRPSRLPVGSALAMTTVEGVVPIMCNTVAPATGSGRVELFSRDLKDRFGYGLPRYEPVERGFPFTIISPSSPRRTNATFGHCALSEGREEVEINPADAERRGISDGDLLRVFNDRGETHLVARTTDAVLPGVLYTPKGVWLSASPTGQTVNALLDADIRTDIEDGACCNEAFCDVARAG